jgi:dynein heavy chain
MTYVEAIISDFYNVVKLVKRLDRTEGDFLKEMEEHEAVRFHVHRIIEECERNQQACKEYRKPYLAKKHLWVKDIETTLQTFLKEEGGRLPLEGTENDPVVEGEERKLGLPDLPVFQAKISELRDEESEIKSFGASINEGWLKIDAKPIKQAVGKIASKWSATHTTWLTKYVDEEIATLQTFITSVQAGLGEEVEENDQAKLIEAMTYVRDVRLNSDRIDGMFEPLKGTLGLLKKFGIPIDDETVEVLEMIPFKWEDTKKVTTNAREALGPLQSQQQDKVREKTDEFRATVKEFAETFKHEAPFPSTAPTPTARRSRARTRI